jgi:carotenoid cleavage dioxygenase
MTYYEISPEGELLYDVWFEVPYYCMMHDFAITPDYALFSVMPMTSNWERLKAGKPHFGFDTSAHLSGRDAAQAGHHRRRHPLVQGRNCFTAHVMNAFQEGTRLHLDLPVAANNMMPFFPDIDDAPFDPVAGARS